jgi:transposase
VGAVRPDDLSREQLLDLVKQLLERVAVLEAELARARKDSSNSSKPPSSDIVKPPSRPQGGGGKRHIGGQPGHPRHERPEIPEDRVDRTVQLRLEFCPEGHGRVRPANRPPKTFLQVGLVEQPFVVTKYLCPAYWCPACHVFHYAPLPPEVERSGFFDPRATALVGWLKSRSHDSYRTVQEFLRDIGRLEVSTGFLAKTVQKVSAALSAPYTELEAAVRREPRLNVDETGHPENKRHLWTWAFRAAAFTLFKIDPSRGSKVLGKVLGADFKGVLGCDFLPTYRKYSRLHGVSLQFCLAHLIREVRFLTELPDRATRRYGRRVLAALRQVFRVLHRREQMNPAKFQRKLELAAKRVVDTGRRAPDRNETRRFARRFRKHADACFRFVTTPGVEPTNNLAEQAIRFSVIDRRITQGTRSERGRRWSERVWTAIATCSQQGRSFFAYLFSALNAHFANRPVPSLLPSGA